MLTTMNYLMQIRQNHLASKAKSGMETDRVLLLSFIQMQKRTFLFAIFMILKRLLEMAMQEMLLITIIAIL